MAAAAGSAAAGGKSTMLSDEDIRALSGVPDLRILRYPELKTCATWDTLVSNSGKAAAVLFLTENDTTGHWMAAFNGPGNTAVVFDPLGLGVDAERKLLPAAQNAKLGQQDPEFARLLVTAEQKGMKPAVNHTDFQEFKASVNTCGRWVALRIARRNLSPADFSRYVRDSMRSSGCRNADEWVTKVTQAASGGTTAPTATDMEGPADDSSASDLVRGGYGGGALCGGGVVEKVRRFRHIVHHELRNRDAKEYPALMNELQTLFEDLTGDTEMRAFDALRKYKTINAMLKALMLPEEWEEVENAGFGYSTDADTGQGSTSDKKRRRGDSPKPESEAGAPAPPDESEPEYDPLRPESLEEIAGYFARRGVNGGKWKQAEHAMIAYARKHGMHSRLVTNLRDYYQRAIQDLDKTSTAAVPEPLPSAPTAAAAPEAASVPAGAAAAAAPSMPPPPTADELCAFFSNPLSKTLDKVARNEEKWKEPLDPDLPKHPVYPLAWEANPGKLVVPSGRIQPYNYRARSPYSYIADDVRNQLYDHYIPYFKSVIRSGEDPVNGMSLKRFKSKVEQPLLAALEASSSKISGLHKSMLPQLVEHLLQHAHTDVSNSIHHDHDLEHGIPPRGNYAGKKHTDNNLGHEGLLVDFLQEKDYLEFAEHVYRGVGRHNLASGLDFIMRLAENHPELPNEAIRNARTHYRSVWEAHKLHEDLLHAHFKREYPSAPRPKPEGPLLPLPKPRPTAADVSAENLVRNVNNHYVGPRPRSDVVDLTGSGGLYGGSAHAWGAQLAGHLAECDTGHYHAFHAKYDEDLTGSGFFDDIGNAFKTAWDTTTGALKEGVNRISNFVSGARTGYPPSAAQALERWSNWKVKKLTLRRTPVSAPLNGLVDAISLGTFNQARQAEGVGDLYHLGLACFIESPDSHDAITVLVEKNAVINIAQTGDVPQQTLSVPAPDPPITFGEFMGRAQRAMGDEKFFKYSAFNNNCQDFVSGILDANGVLTPAAVGFLKQNVENVKRRVAGHTGAVADAFTDLGARFDRLIQGGDLQGGALEGCGPMPPESELQPLAKASYKGTAPFQVGSYTLIHETPTLKFYKDGRTNTIVVAIRGTADARDVSAWAPVAMNTVGETARWKDDEGVFKEVQAKYPQSAFDYYAVGHSLGGAIADEALRHGFVKEALSYNAAVQLKDLGAADPRHHRVYSHSDLLGKLGSWFGLQGNNETRHVAAEGALAGHQLTNFDDVATPSAATPSQTAPTFSVTPDETTQAMRMRGRGGPCTRSMRKGGMLRKVLDRQTNPSTKLERDLRARSTHAVVSRVEKPYMEADERARDHRMASFHRWQADRTHAAVAADRAEQARLDAEAHRKGADYEAFQRWFRGTRQGLAGEELRRQSGEDDEDPKELLGHWQGRADVIIEKWNPRTRLYTVRIYDIPEDEDTSDVGVDWTELHDIYPSRVEHWTHARVMSTADSVPTTDHTLALGDAPSGHGHGRKKART